MYLVMFPFYPNIISKPNEKYIADSNVNYLYIKGWRQKFHLPMGTGIVRGRFNCPLLLPGATTLFLIMSGHHLIQLLTAACIQGRCNGGRVSAPGKIPVGNSCFLSKNRAILQLVSKYLSCHTYVFILHANMMALCVLITAINSTSLLANEIYISINKTGIDIR